MKPVLAIAGCGVRLEVGLYGSPSERSHVALAGPRPRSEYVVAAVDLLMRSAGLELPDLDAVVATRGPGSFTGVRVALATAQGIALAGSLPSAGFPSLLVQAARAADRRCLAVQPARRGQVYAQAFAREIEMPTATSEPSVLELEELRTSALPVVAPPGLELPDGTPLAQVVIDTSAALVVLFRAGADGPQHRLTPLYLEPPAATPPAPRMAPWQRSPTAS